jgi:uncharacterized membrane protein
MASHIKSVAKAITWRVLGAADTFVLSFLVTGKATAAVGIVGFELFTKSVLYYGHERAWEISWLSNPSWGDALAKSGSRLRLVRVIAWRRLVRHDALRCAQPALRLAVITSEETIEA